MGPLPQLKRMKKTLRSLKTRVGRVHCEMSLQIERIPPLAHGLLINKHDSKKSLVHK